MLGYRADHVRAAIERQAPPDVAIRFTENPDWHLENGVSVLAARRYLQSRFALLMGDHLFDARVLRQLLRATACPGESVLAVDSRPTDPAIADEATKVRLRGSRIIAIGKALTEYDALDTGLFVCAPSLFSALESAGALGGEIRGQSALSCLLRSPFHGCLDAGSNRFRTHDARCVRIRSLGLS